MTKKLHKSNILNFHISLASYSVFVFINIYLLYDFINMSGKDGGGGELLRLFLCLLLVWPISALILLFYFIFGGISLANFLELCSWYRKGISMNEIPKMKSILDWFDVTAVMRCIFLVVWSILCFLICLSDLSGGIFLSLCLLSVTLCIASVVAGFNTKYEFKSAFQQSNQRRIR